MWITVSSLKKGMHINSSYHDGEIHKSLLPSGLHSKKCTVGKYPSFVIELLTRGLSWCVYTSDCPQPVNWSAWTSWVKKRWGGRGLVRTTRSGRVHPCCCISRYSLHLVTFWRPWWWLLFSRSVVSNSVTPWTAARLSFTVSQSLLRLMFIESVMPSNYLILHHPLLLCPQSLPASGSFPVSQHFVSHGQSIGASPSASVLPLNIQGWFPLRLTGLISLPSKGLSRVFSSRRPWLFHCNLSPWTPHQYCCKQLKNWGRWDSWLTKCIHFPQHQRTLV